MVEYSCDICNFRTIKKTNMSRHTLSNQHKLKSIEAEKHANENSNSALRTCVPRENKNIINKKSYTCDICSICLSTASSYSRHKKLCKKKLESEEIQKEQAAKLENQKVYTQKECDEKVEEIRISYNKKIEQMKQNNIKNELEMTNLNMENITNIHRQYRMRIDEMNKTCQEKIKLLEHEIIQKDNMINNTNNINNMDNSMDRKVSYNHPIATFEKRHVCNFCNFSYTSSHGLSKHRKKCGDKAAIETKLNHMQQLHEEKLDKLQRDISSNHILIEQLKMSNSNLIETNQYLHALFQVSKEDIAQSMSAMTYITSKYKNAPILSQMKNYISIGYSDKEKFLDLVIYENEKETLHKFIGEFIIKYYKKNNSSLQSLWNTDSSRLTYVIRQLSANNKLEWIIDKDGIETTKIIIKPLLEFIHTILKR